MYRDNCRSDRWGWAQMKYRRAPAGQEIFTVTVWVKIQADGLRSGDEGDRYLHSAQRVGPLVVWFCSGLILNVSDTSCGCGFWSNLKDKLLPHIYGPEIRPVDQVALIWNSNLWDCLHCSHSIQQPHPMTYLDKRCWNCYQDKNLNSPPAVSLHSGSLMRFKDLLWKWLLKVPLCWI